MQSTHPPLKTSNVLTSLYWQVNGSSGYSNYYQAENNLEGTSQSFAYPGRELSRESFQSRSPTTKVESTTSKVNEVLKALHIAKLSIQNTGGRRTSISNPYYPTLEHRFACLLSEKTPLSCTHCSGINVVVNWLSFRYISIDVRRFNKRRY